MDRNLGALDPEKSGVYGPTPIGLYYQWGRKDPFLGTTSTIQWNTMASTLDWPYSVSSDALHGNIEYTISHPTTLIHGNTYNHDWYYTGDVTTDNTRWTTSEREKSIYDPCPVGWRVPDGGENGIWNVAECEISAQYVGRGVYFDTQTPSKTWYPNSGRMNDRGSFEGLASKGGTSYYWSASPCGDESNQAYCLYMYCLSKEANLGYQCSIYPCNKINRGCSCVVRCQKE